MALMSDGTLKTELSAFFERILGDSSVYKVFVGRECSILLMIASSLTSEDLRTRNDIMSDAGFLTHADEIVSYYTSHRSFPSIVLVDESITYGRALNTILLEWEQVLTNRFQQQGIHMLSHELRNQLAAALRIYVFMQKFEDTLLIDAYKPVVQSTFSFDAPEAFDKTYLRLQRILLDSDKVNAVYTVSCQLKANGISAIKNFLSEKQYTMVSPEPVIGDEADSAFENYCIFLRYFPNRIAPKAFSVIRLFERNQQAHFIPYVYFMDWDEGVSEQIANEIDNHFRLQLGHLALSELGAFGRVQSELTATIINFKLLQSLIVEAGIPENAVSFDYDQVHFSLGGDDRSRHLLQALHDQPAMSFDLYHQWIAGLAEASNEPFGYFDKTSRTTSLMIKRRIRDIVRKLVYQRGIDAECAAYHALNGGLTQKMLENGNKKAAISFLFSAYNKEFQNRFKHSAPDMDLAIAQLMLMMDHGYVATVASDVDTAGCNTFSHLMRVSECSLSLYPLAYAEYIPLLIEMEKQCLGKWQDMKEQLAQYIPDDQEQPDLSQELWCMAEGVHKIGRTMDSLTWYAKEQNVPMGQDNPEVQKYRLWFFDY